MKNVMGPAVRRVRCRSGVSIEDLAARVARRGYSLTSKQIAAIECGRRQVKDLEVRHLAQALNVRVEVLFAPRNHARTKVAAR